MKLYGLIGRTLGHSYSQKYFQSKFEKEGLDDSIYELFELENCHDVVNLFKSKPTLKGLNVTIPYKEEIIPYLDILDPIAKSIGAVNTIKVDQTTNTLTGFNTDYYGFKNSIKPFLASQHERALILGTGGASKAVQQVFKDLNMEFLLVSRNPNSENQISYDEVNDYVMKHHKLIVNTTPLGMQPDINAKPNIPYDTLNEDYFLCDLIYNPEDSQFLKEGKIRNTVTLNGLSMLHLQAEKSWKIWNS